MSKPIDGPGRSGQSHPFVHKIRVRWADIDTARIAYSGRFPVFALEAIEAWFENTLGIIWGVNTPEQGRGNPFVHLEMDILSVLTARDTVYVAVWVERIGKSSLSFYVEGHVPPDRKSFTGRFTCVFVRSPARTPIAISDQQRALIEAYQAACKGASAPGAFSLGKAAD
jgi:acyl-CoA thioesterase FadM